MYRACTGRCCVGHCFKPSVHFEPPLETLASAMETVWKPSASLETFWKPQVVLETVWKPQSKLETLWKSLRLETIWKRGFQIRIERKVTKSWKPFGNPLGVSKSH